MPHFDDEHNQLSVTNLIDYPVISNPDPIELLLRGKLSHPCWPGIHAEILDPREYLSLGITFEFLELSVCMWSELDLIRHDPAL
jgi:hypothetical protein